MPRLLLALGAAAALAASARADDPPPPPGPSDAAPQESARPDPVEGRAGAPRAEPNEVVVTATREPRPPAGVPTPVTVLSGEDLAASAGSTPDAVLRAVPSVATFRRSTSLVADPSSQGVNLRGVGPSGVGRGLVLDDGVPVNDPFGGWIYWRALPRLGTARLEVAPGGASALYGTFALGGVVERVARPVDETGVALELAGGSLQTLNGAARAARAWDGGGLALEADSLRTGGFQVVAPWDRGAIDHRASADHLTLGLRAEHAPRPGLRLRLGADAFGEDQDGGTRYTTAQARMLTGRAGLDWRGEAGRLALTLYGGGRRFEQTRARVSEDRGTEALAAAQEIPSTDAGVTLLASGTPAGPRHRLSAGLDARRVAGTARERLFPTGDDPARTVAREARGAQLLAGVFAQDAFRIAPGLELAGALRLDAWRNEDARLATTAASGAETAAELGPRTRTQLSPRLAALWRPVEALALRAAAYRAFRAPTLNELYRTFQVGTVVTAPNPELRAEVLSGIEAGPEVTAGPVRARATAFASVLDDPITTVTLAAPLPGGATRRRENLGRARFRGVETELEAALSPRVRVGAAWTFVDARVVEAPGSPALVGKRVAQDPAHRLAATVSVAAPRGVQVSVAVRALSDQYEDDRNTLPMGGYAVVDATVIAPLGSGLALFVAGENLTDRQYLVGRAGVDTIGQPLTIRAGLRYASGGAR